MGEPGRHLHLLLEALGHPGARRGLARQKFEGHDPAHADVLGLEHLPHGPLSQKVQQPIAADHQLGRPALQEPLGLIFGQPAAAKQVGHQGRCGRASGHQARQRLELVGRQEPILSELLGQGGRGGHGRASSGLDESEGLRPILAAAGWERQGKQAMAGVGAL